MAEGINVKFGATDAGFSGTVAKVNNSMKSMDDNTKKVSNSVSTSFASMAKAGAALALGFGAMNIALAGFKSVISNFGDALDMGGRLSDLSARTGESAGKLLLLERAFSNAGSSAENVGPTINKLQKFIDDASEAGSAQAKTMAMIGITYDDLKSKSPVEQFRTTAEAISAIGDDGTRAVIAMDIFGKSGGELLPLLRDFKSGLEGAKEELGGMVEIMDSKSAVFDTVSDKIEIVKGKFTEFAAGILSQTVPALELLFTSLAKIDAAGMGESFAKAFIGGQEAMEGFSGALAAMKLGEFRLSFEIAWASITLQAAQSANSIYASLQASFAAAAKFLTVSLGPGSAAWTMLDSGFEVIGGKMAVSLSRAIHSIVKEFVFVSQESKATMLDNIKLIEVGVENSSNKMKNSLGQVPGDFILAGQEAKKAFDESAMSASTLVETAGLKLDLDSKMLELTNKQGAAASTAASDALAALQKQQDLSGYQIKIGEQRVTNAERLKELEQEIATANATGNKQLSGELEAEKSRLTQLERSLAMGKTHQQAMADAGMAYAQSLANANNEAGKVTAELKKQLSLSSEISAKVKAAQDKEQIDPGGKNEKLANEALAKGDFGKAERAGKSIEKGEANKRIQDAFNKDENAKNDQGKLGKSLQDIAKQEGIDTKGKSSKDLRNELDKRASDKADKAAEDDRKRKEELAPGKGGKEGPGQEKGDMMNEIKTLVEAIKTTLNKIEPKLPTHALSA